jgi:hypothetical protein
VRCAALLCSALLCSALNAAVMVVCVQVLINQLQNQLVLEAAARRLERMCYNDQILQLQQSASELFVQRQEALAQAGVGVNALLTAGGKAPAAN